jgi:small-conductance mechanosensitive channel
LGDRIEIAGVRGDVVDIRMFQHSLMEIGNWIDADDRTGRVLHVPNSLAMSATVANYTKGWFVHIWDELSVIITYESNLEDARRMLKNIVDCSAGESVPTAERGATAHYLVMDASVRATVFVAVKDYGIQLTARYICDPRKRRGTKQIIWEGVLRAFASRDDIAFAYPTQRFYDNVAEGKAGVRPPSPRKTRTVIE